MQVPLFRALQSINIPDDQAAAVVMGIEDYLAMKIEDATKGLEQKLDALNRQINFVGIMIGLATLLISGATIAAKFIH